MSFTSTATTSVNAYTTTPATSVISSTTNGTTSETAYTTTANTLIIFSTTKQPLLELPTPPPLPLL
jgi:hypothetical protein